MLTPTHILGYDLYYHPNKTALQRFKGLCKIYPGATGIRMIRMGGAYGVGGVNNKGLRNYLIGYIEGEKWDEGY